jgi:hypothetical protein
LLRKKYNGAEDNAVFSPPNRSLSIPGGVEEKLFRRKSSSKDLHMRKGCITIRRDKFC